MIKGKRLFKEGNTAISFLICFAFSALVIILLSLIFALVANMSEDPTGRLGIFSLAAMIISAAAGGVFSARFCKESQLGFATLVALAIVLVMLLFCVILNAGKISGAAFMNYACYIGVAALSAFFGRRKEGHRRHRR